MNQKGHKKLLLIGSSKGAGHLLNFKALIEPYFDEILLVSGHVVKDQQALTFNFGLKNPFQFFKTIKELRRLILDFQPDVIHVHQANSYGFLSALANRGLKPLVLTTWGSDVLLLPQKNSFYKFMVGYALKQANAITADAHFMAKAIEETDRRREKQVAYNLSRGVDPQPLRKKIADITDDIMREEADTAALIAENKGKSGGKLKSGLSATATKGRKGIAGKAYDEILSVVIELEAQMKAAASELQFELAARIRDEMVELKRELRQMEKAGHVD